MQEVLGSVFTVDTTSTRRTVKTSGSDVKRFGEREREILLLLSEGENMTSPLLGVTSPSLTEVTTACPEMNPIVTLPNVPSRSSTRLIVLVTSSTTGVRELVEKDILRNKFAMKQCYERYNNDCVT